MICVMESSVWRRWTGIMAIPISRTRVATPTPVTEVSVVGPELWPAPILPHKSEFRRHMDIMMLVMAPL